MVQVNGSVVSLVHEIKRLAAAVGYADCGIAGAEPFREFGESLDRLIGMFPETRPLYEKMRCREDPRRDAPWVNSIIVCIRRYGKYKLPAGAVGVIGRNYLADRRFKGCPDHGMPARMKEGLLELGLRVRAGGVPDRQAAARAGVASFGRNCFAYSRRYGSWVNIECWRVDAVLEADEPACGTPCPEGCCECIRACPTSALVEPFVMKMDRCIAHLTFEAPEPIDADLWSSMGRWVYGCDVCQEVCPLNKGKWEPLEDAAWMTGIGEHLQPDALAAMDQKTYEDVIHPRFWYIPKENLQRWHANARRALESMKSG